MIRRTIKNIKGSSVFAAIVGALIVMACQWFYADLWQGNDLPIDMVQVKFDKIDQKDQWIENIDIFVGPAIGIRSNNTNSVPLAVPTPGFATSTVTEAAKTSTPDMPKFALRGVTTG